MSFLIACLVCGKEALLVFMTMDEDNNLCNGDDDGGSSGSNRRLQRCATRKEQLFTEISRSTS